MLPDALARPEHSVGRDNRAGQDRLWSRWTVAQRAVGSDRIVVLSLALDEHLCLLECEEGFAVEQSVSKLCSEIPSERQTSLTVWPWDRPTSASRSRLMIGSGL